MQEITGIISKNYAQKGAVKPRNTTSRTYTGYQPMMAFKKADVNASSKSRIDALLNDRHLEVSIKGHW